MLLSSPSPRAACALLLALLALGLPPPARCSGLTVQLDAFGLHGVRVRVAPSGNGIVQPKHTALLAAAPASTPSVPSSATRVTSGNLMVEADASTGMVMATRLSDNTVVLRQETLRFSAPMAPVLNKKNRGLVVAFEGHGAGERVYGLGEHRTGKVNQMPYQQDFSHSQTYGFSHGGDVSIPWYCSSLGYGFVWNSAAYGNVSLSGDSLQWVSWAAENADFWITVPPANSTNVLADLMHNYVDAVGHASRMPFDATGFIQCKNRYRNQTQLLDVARGYVDRGLPISVIVIDYFHWVNQGDWSFNPTCWPDPQAMVDELERLGIHLMVTFWPFQTPPSQHWQQFNSSGYLVKNLDGQVEPYDNSYYLYDSFNTEAQNATWKAFMEGYGRYGIRRLWLDAAEPEHPKPDKIGQWQFADGTDGEVGEAWVRNHVKTIADGMSSIGVGADDYFVLPRSTWSGAWSHSAGLWSGDIPSTFEELATQVRVGQGVAMSGVVLWTTDIGGYSGGDPSDPVFQDLIVRWFQFGAFCPLFRLHGQRKGGPPANECGSTNGDNEVWNLAKDPKHYNSIVTVMRLRENLRSYVTDINEEAAATGMPMMRPLVLQFPDDPNCAAGYVEDQFMFGPDWLVAPVLGQVSSRSLYLPKLDPSETWVYFYNDTAVGSGGVNITMDTPIEEFPLFYRRPIPQAPTTQAVLLYSAERHDAVLCVSSECLSDNQPSTKPPYTTLSVEGRAWASPGQVTVGGEVQTLVPLTLWYSYSREDNFVATNSTPPDASYTNTFNNGYVLGTAAKGTVALEVWKTGDGSHYATVASDAGRKWAASHGYAKSFVTGYILPAAPGTA